MKMVFMTNTRRFLLGTAALGATLLVPLAGCASGTQPTAGEGPRIVTSAYPFQFVAERVAGTDGTVTNLTAPGAEPHDLELTPKQVGSLSDADLVVYEKGFQPAVDEAVSQSGAGNVLDTTSVVPLEPLTESGEHGGEHAGEGTEEPAGETGDDHEHVTGPKAASIRTSGWTPPSWPPSRPPWPTSWRRSIPSTPPSTGPTPSSSAAELAALDQEFRSGLTGCLRTDFITSHTAFGYLATRYDLTQIGIGGLSPDTEPSPARIAAIQREATEHQVTTIFTETLASPAVAEAIAGDLGLRTDVLDPVEGITDKSRGQDYLAVMQANLTALQRANGCPIT